jgi:indole-3-glycerol phosphate synthase
MSTDILKKIVAAKKEEVATAKQLVPEAHLRQSVRPRSDRRPFYETLAQPGPAGANIIAEVKKASPSKGLIRPDLDPASYAASYEHGGAAAISVLTDTEFFQGSIEDLMTARQATSLPVLRKDFIVSSYQIYQARQMGADAVLLITRILTPQQLHDYLSLSQELELDALVEIHTDTDLAAATKAGAQLLGINNRNLQTFQTDLQTSVRLASQLGPRQVAVAESGIKDRSDIEILLDAGVWNFLIGESLVRAEKPDALLKSFLGE